MIVRMPDVIQAALTRYSRLSHISESCCHAKQASPAMSMPPLVAMPATMASACCRPMMSRSVRGSFSSLARNCGVSTPPLLHGIDGMHRYL